MPSKADVKAWKAQLVAQAEHVPNSNINESVWKTLIDCETFLKIIPCSHGPHLAREKTATALKTSCVIHYTGELSVDQAQ